MDFWGPSESSDATLKRFEFSGVPDPDSHGCADPFLHQSVAWLVASGQARVVDCDTGDGSYRGEVEAVCWERTLSMILSYSNRIAVGSVIIISIDLYDVRE